MDIKCYKGAKENEETTITGGKSTSLQEIRQILTAKGFIPADSGKEAYRFIFKEVTNERMNLTDLYVALGLENIIPVSQIWGNECQVILSNINSEKSPDLAGFGCTWWFDRYVSARCILNKYDKIARQHNKERNAFQPIMLTDVIAVSEKLKYVHYPNVCLCVEGSVVGFEISSWGAEGFVYHVAPVAGEPIVNRLYKTFGDNPGQYATAHPRCWQKDKKTIEIWATDKLTDVLPSQSVAYQKIVVSTRNLTSYKANGQVYSSDRQPPMLMSAGRMNVFLLGESISQQDLQRNLATAGEKDPEPKEVIIVDGDNITPGTATKNDASNEKHGTISCCKFPPEDETLGQIAIHFFVFKNEEEARRTVKCLNSPNPDIWK